MQFQREEIPGTALNSSAILLRPGFRAQSQFVSFILLTVVDLASLILATEKDMRV